MTSRDYALISAAVPPDLPVPAGMPAALRQLIDWPGADSIMRLALARLYGRKRDRDAVAGAWDEAKRLGYTMRDLLETMPAGPARNWCWLKLGYANRNGT